ncbi:hypothetical protein [Agrobacterium pusense]|uniref:hypothetical protein n=1 Tax=Agrobacterium pusense TaxID=648995 RepID=UPI000512CC18|nr:hypothetical protein [Agrobacterium pusense]ANV23745.1 hypothetical protein BA939_07185 [Rhizobium sp. S41]KGE79799.1 hypothetical protein LW14_27065 [Rhizobium sp. H41]QWW73344.1 hypothetical protein KP800_11550 [Agrobacterium pusense]
MKYDLASHECELRLSGDRKNLVVALSHKENFAFYRQPFTQSVLFVRDKRHNYYSLYPGMVIDLVKSIIEEHGFNNVVFFGLSKGGYGALLLSALAGRRMPDVQFRALSFSPAARLYPKNSNVTFPSYLAMIRRSETNERLAGNLQKHGDLSKFIGEPNVFWRIVYSEGNLPDSLEAGTLIHPNIQKYPLPFSFHGSTIPFTLDRTNSDQVSREVDAIYKDAANDPDLKATVPESAEHLKRQLMQAKWIPTLVEIIDDTLSTNF